MVTVRDLPPRPLRLLVVMPSWVGDVVMATPTLRLLRETLPGAFIGALVRPGPDALLNGLDTLDELHVERSQGVLGPKFVAAKLRPRRYDTALLLTNSFSTALIARIAGVPRRVGYDRDGRGMLLTRRLRAPKRRDGKWAVVPAVRYYWDAAVEMLRLFDIDAAPADPSDPLALPEGATMELTVTDDERSAADGVLQRAGVEGPFAILNPGGNNAAKRWPADRFARVADHLAQTRGWRVLVNGSPGEAELCDDVARRCAVAEAVSLPACGMTMPALKGVVERAALLVTNDTGPRHIAAALRIPVVTLFGPTDHRWTLIPAPAGERTVLADPDAPPEQLANDDPDRHRVERISVERAVEAVDDVLRNG